MGDEPGGFVIRVEGVGGVVRARLFEGDVHSMCIGGVLGPGCKQLQVTANTVRFGCSGKGGRTALTT